MKQFLSELPEVGIRKSTVTFERLINLLSRIPANEMYKYQNGDIIEALLCLAIEIQMLKDEISTLKNKPETIL